MRNRYITSHKKLPIVLVALLLAFISVGKEKDTNIVCFAAKNKWVCAPEGQQELANKKASKMLEKSKSELKDPNIVIRTIDIPKFSSVIKEEKKAEKKDIITPQTNTPTKNAAIVSSKRTNVAVSTADKKQENPYAKLWSHQLVGVSTPQNAVNFVIKNNLNKDEVLIVKSTRDNKDWWVVLYGLYKTRTIGLENEVNLPSTIDKHWLRSLRNLKVLGFIEKY